MKILLIARPFAPDSVIGAIRVTKFAKYLKKEGHDVVVITSGKCFTKPCSSNLLGLEDVPIYSYISKKRISGYEVIDKSSAQIRYAKKESRIIKNVKVFLHLFYDVFFFYVLSGRKIKDEILNLYSMETSLRGFDVVIASFSPFGCIQAGKQISHVEKAKFVIDFRDLMTNVNYTPIVRFVNKFTQKRYAKKSDISLCVSDGNSQMLARLTGCKEKIRTIYNGYDGISSKIGLKRKLTDELVICYTGTLYEGARDLGPLFYAIRNTKQKNPIDVHFVYAGKDGIIVKRQAAKYGMESIIIDRGLVSSEEAEIIQAESDLFVVASWNTKLDQGILTGKFYEALRCRKPVIAIVSGEVPHSELRSLIEKYNLGVCYEESDKNKNKDLLVEYLTRQYEFKQKAGNVLYEPKNEVFNMFEYKTIVQNLNQLLEYN